MERARAVQAKISWKAAVGQALLYLTIMAFYGYCFFWGGYLKYNFVKNDLTGKIYTGGETMGIMFSVVTGAFQITATGP